jgi:tetraether lipid synthase
MLELGSIPVVVEPRREQPHVARLAALKARLQALDADAARREFALPPEAALLKSTVSICAACLEHVPAIVYRDRQRILLKKRCSRHGLAVAVAENDAAYYRLSSKDQAGKRYASDGIVALPPYQRCCGPSAGSASSGSAPAASSCCGGVAGARAHSLRRADCADQSENKTCTVLVEITNACNLACRVCYADSKGDRLLPFDAFRSYILDLVERKGALDSVQLTGGEASLHPDYWAMIDWLYHCEGVRKIYLPTNGLELSKAATASRLRPYRSKVLVLLQFDGRSETTNQALRAANPRRARERLIRKLDRAGICMQLTMTLARNVSESEIAWVVRQGIKHKNVRLIGMLPAFYSGRYDLAQDPLERMTLSDVVKGIAAGMPGKAVPHDFLPIPCSHPNCGWATLFARRFGLFFNIAKHVDLDAVMNDVAYKTILDKREMQALLGSRYRRHWQRLLSWVGRRLIRPQDVFGIAIKPFMDRFNYDQDRIAACCHHTLDTDGRLVSFCEYNARIREHDAWARFPKLA